MLVVEVGEQVPRGEGGNSFLATFQDWYLAVSHMANNDFWRRINNFLNLSDTRKISVIILIFEPCDLCPNDADEMANSVDPDQTARSSLNWAYTVCLDLSVRKLRNITVKHIGSIYNTTAGGNEECSEDIKLISK